MNKWPDNFDFESDKICQQIFKPFIETQLNALKALDQSRPPNITYIFHEHTERVAQNVKDTCLYMGLSETIANNMYWATLPHDIGKAALPPHIWDVDEKPAENLKKLRRTHAMLGAQIVEEHFPAMDHPFKALMTDIMQYHHEQMDGQGEHGVAGADLSMPVRLVALVEAFDGWSIFRPHFGDRDISVSGVLKRMRDEKMHMFDRELFELFEKMMLEKDKKGA